MLLGKNMKKTLLFGILFFLLFLGIINQVNAHCPLCTGAVVASAAVANYYGLDISIIGLFVGAFSISLGLWVGRVIKKRFIPFQTSLLVILSFLSTVIPSVLVVKSDSLYLPVLLFGAEGSVFNRVYLLDKLLLGSIIGGIVSVFAYWLHKHIKAVKGRVLFPFQGIVITLAFLMITGAILYFIL